VGQQFTTKTVKPVSLNDTIIIIHDSFHHHHHIRLLEVVIRNQ